MHIQLGHSPQNSLLAVKSWRLLLAALVLSVLGHFVLFFGLPFLSLGSSSEIPDDLIIRTDLKPEPPKKIQIARSSKKLLSSQSALSDKTVEQGAVGQGGHIEQAGVPFKLPEPGIIYYDAYLDGQKYQTGEIEWDVDGTHYRLYINIPYAFVGPFIFESRGTVDSFGIAPSIFWAQRGTRPPRYSRFDRDGNGGGRMFFSEKPDFTPDILPGTQDRFSLMFQFASLLNGDSKIDEPGTMKAIPVVDYNTLELWQFKSYGETISDAIPTLGNAVNRHYALMQRENDPYKRQIDFWLAKDLEWLPGRIRAQDGNGRVIELIFKQKGSRPSNANP